MRGQGALERRHKTPEGKEGIRGTKAGINDDRPDYDYIGLEKILIFGCLYSWWIDWQKSHLRGDCDLLRDLLSLDRAQITVGNNCAGLDLEPESE